jgi:hypothetical protein
VVRLVDRFLPAPDVRTVHSIRIRASPERVMHETEQFDLESLGVVRALFRIRGWMLRARPLPSHVARGLVDRLSSIGWGTLAHEPGRQRVFGAVTRPWEGDVRFTPVAPEAFASFAEPGLVKIAWTLEAERDPRRLDVTVFRTETRASGTDTDARRRFRRYWRLVRPGVVLIRLVLLPAVRRKCERPPGPSGAP